MRMMDIPVFANAIEVTDLNDLYKARLARGITAHGTAGIVLLGYMIAPNDAAAREFASSRIQTWVDNGEPGPLPGLEIIHQHWGRVGDIVHVHHDMAEGGHQQTRGGASIGKAIHLVAEVAKSKGTRPAHLKKVWSTYKDVGHLVTAAIIIAADIQSRHISTGLGIVQQQLVPLRVTMLLPDVLIALGMSIQAYGLAREECPMFDPDTLWRIPSNIGLTPLPIPSRRIRPEDVRILNARRAGNRGKRQKFEPAPIPQGPLP